MLAVCPSSSRVHSLVLCSTMFTGLGSGHSTVTIVLHSTKEYTWEDEGMDWTWEDQRQFVPANWIGVMRHYKSFWSTEAQNLTVPHY